MQSDILELFGLPCGDLLYALRAPGLWSRPMRVTIRSRSAEREGLAVALGPALRAPAGAAFFWLTRWHSGPLMIDRPLAH